MKITTFLLKIFNMLFLVKVAVQATESWDVLSFQYAASALWLVQDLTLKTWQIYFIFTCTAYLHT